MNAYGILSFNFSGPPSNLRGSLVNYATTPWIDQIKDVYCRKIRTSIESAKKTAGGLLITTDHISELEDFEALSLQTLSALGQDRNELKRMILAAREDEYLFSLCEHYDILDKIVLHADKEKSLRLRLHIFDDNYFDRPHNHRWSYSSHILSGSYRHIIFSVNAKDNDPDTRHLVPVLIRREKKGDFYTLHHSQYHSVTAEPNTVTLILRGPARADRFRVMDRETKESWWQYGASLESKEEQNKKKMTRERFDFLVEKLTRIGVI